jgi:pimeloyl-ACP methyl ester carboxylesterase
MFTALLLPSIAANLETKPVDIGGGRLVMAGYRDQMLDLMARLDGVPEPSMIGGHSMGGAVANLMAQTVEWKKPPRVCITIAAPMHGNQGFNTAAVVPRMRIEREADPAPRWPPALAALYEQPAGVDWLHGRTVTLCDHRPTLVDFLLSWGDHDIVKYASDIEALPLASAA